MQSIPSPSVVMSSSLSPAHAQNWPTCYLLESPPSGVGQDRQRAIAALGLDGSHSIPALDEAIQLASRYLGTPIAWISVACDTIEQLKSTHGLSALGLGNTLATERQLPLAAGLSADVIESRQPLAVPDATQVPTLAQRDLVAVYGIVAFCAVPLLTADGQCVGVLAVMDTQARTFSQQDVCFLEMAARWGLNEHERTLVLRSPQMSAPNRVDCDRLAESRSPVDAVRLHLISHLIQDLRNPLTAVMGMTSMLSREIYGPLTEKQREYIDIVRRSSQTLMTQVDEIIDLGLVDPEAADLVPTPVDISRLGEQVITTLAPLAEKLSQTLNLTVEPNQHLWILDQHTVKQLLYHAVFSIMHMASENSTLRVHASRKGQSLSLAVWVSNPWLGEGLPPTIISLCHALGGGYGAQRLNVDEVAQDLLGGDMDAATLSKQWLGLVLCQHLAQHHGGQVNLHGNAEAGYRLMISLPALRTVAPMPQSA